MRADIHDGPEQMLQSKAGYIDARPLTASSAKPLATHGRTIHLGQTEKSSLRANVFRVTPETCIAQCSPHVSKMPQAAAPARVCASLSVNRAERVHTVGSQIPLT